MRVFWDFAKWMVVCLFRCGREIQHRIAIYKINRNNGVHPNIFWGVSGTAELLGGVVICERSNVTVSPEAFLKLGRNVFIGKDSELGATVRIVIGEGTSLQVRSIILGNVEIGRGCLFGPNLYISSGSHRFSDSPALPIRIQDQQFDKRADTDLVWIGDDCWFGINVVILPGVNIGKGCVVGANTVVTNSLPPYSVAVGAPARVIKKRLEFNPPRRIVAKNLADFPYFYSGFGNEADENGLLADQDFTIALGIDEEMFFSVTFWAPSPGIITFNQQSQRFEEGRQTLRWQCDAGLKGYLHFQTKLQNDHKITLIEAQGLSS